MRLPDADDLFRPTVVPDGEAPAARPGPESQQQPQRTGQADAAAPDRRRTTRNASGRVRHDEKMTVYVTADELVEIENARLALRRHHGLAVDRGRLVREAVALVLADLDRMGEESPLVRRLGGG